MVEWGGAVASSSSSGAAPCAGVETPVTTRRFSRARFGQQKESWIRKACSTRECSSIRKPGPRANGGQPHERSNNYALSAVHALLSAVIRPAFRPWLKLWLVSRARRFNQDSPSAAEPSSKPSSLVDRMPEPPHHRRHRLPEVPPWPD